MLAHTNQAFVRIEAKIPLLEEARTGANITGSTSRDINRANGTSRCSTIRTTIPNSEDPLASNPIRRLQVRTEDDFHFRSIGKSITSNSPGFRSADGHSRIVDTEGDGSLVAGSVTNSDASGCAVPAGAFAVGLLEFGVGALVHGG